MRPACPQCYDSSSVQLTFRPNDAEFRQFLSIPFRSELIHCVALLHFAAGAGCLEVVALLLRLGVDPNLEGRGRTPLYCVANECSSETPR
jgi:hypothetical protein